jgi:hypothetical protein
MAAYSQYFEGEIVYEYKFTTKMSGLSVERLKNIMGTRQEYYIKGGSYKSLANGSLFSAQI